MFRASDIFGRRAGASTTAVKPKAEPAKKRPSEQSGGPTSRTWDPATGQWVDEELPAEVQELIGIKKPKVTPPVQWNAHKQQTEQAAAGSAAWGGVKKACTKALGPSDVGLVHQAPQTQLGGGGPSGRVDTTAPSVEYRGFCKVDLNDRYFERAEVVVNGRPSFWNTDKQFFVYWQGEEVQRWSICDAASFSAVMAGQLPGWAYKDDQRHLCTANGWMEAWNGSWREPELEVTFRSASHHMPQCEDKALQKAITIVEFKGFAMKELNTRYFYRPNQIIQGTASYWDISGVYFIYWQQEMQRWAICDLKCMDAVKAGQSPGWAYRADSGHFANAIGWIEMRQNQWVDAITESAIISVCSKGVKVEFSGFAKQDLNGQYSEKQDEEVQGRTTFWDSSETYFVYWQSKMRRWAIVDKVSLEQAKAGQAPGWAYRTDAQHFAKSSGWMEAYGREWKKATVQCMVLEGTVEDDSKLIKQGVQDEEEETKTPCSTSLSVEQYHTLTRKVYTEKNPSKLQDLPGLFHKYKGREHELFRQVCDKYKADAEGLAAGLSLSSGAIGTAVPQGADDIGSREEAVTEEADEYAHLENEELPQLTATEYAVLVQSVYERYNPKKLQDMGRLLQKYRNRGRDLYFDVCKKYGAHPVKFRAMDLKEKTEQGAPEES